MQLFPSGKRAAVLSLVLLLFMQGCERWPEDPRNSLQAAHERGSLRVGFVENAPWVTVTDDAQPGGLESGLVAEFAAQQKLEIEWHPGGMEEQIEALKNFELDLLIGGFTLSNPWKTDVGITFPYYIERVDVGTGIKSRKKQQVFMLPPGENALLMAVEKHLLEYSQPALAERLRQEAVP